MDSQEIEKEVVDELNRANILYSITRKRTDKDDKGWEHDLWEVCFTVGEKKEFFEYRTGLGLRNRGVPKISEVIHSLNSDSSSGGVTFTEFRSEFGYNLDSRSALDTYLKCQENGFKLHKILGLSYKKVSELVLEY